MKVAAVDIGTNTVRLYVASVHGGELTEQVRLVDVVGLGRGVDATGRFDRETMARTLGVLAGYRSHLTGVDKVRVIATSASRDAANREEFFDAAEEALGQRPELITGAQEAALSFLGATSSGHAAQTVLVVDVGGGSTEFVYGRGTPSLARSFDIGSVRLSDRVLTDRPIDPATLERAHAHVRAILEPLVIPDDAQTTIGVAGTFTSLSAMALDLPAYDRAMVHHSVLRRGVVEQLVERLASMTVEQTAAIPSLEPKRAPVIAAGAVVVEQLMGVLALDEVTVSEDDILDGVARSLLPQ